MAEHGFSVLIKIFSDESFHTIIFDVGVSPEGFVTNAKRMGLNLTEIEAIVPSHSAGWKGIFAIAEALPKAFVWNSVGNLYQFDAFS
ncbi:MAG: hypothetical protein ACUVT5_03090 [Candidatus Bathyarchaeales archaeon]